MIEIYLVANAQNKKQKQGQKGDHFYSTCIISRSTSNVGFPSEKPSCILTILGGRQGKPFVYRLFCLFCRIKPSGTGEVGCGNLDISFQRLSREGTFSCMCIVHFNFILK